MITCAYCNQPAELVTGREIYPHRPDLYEKNFWQCKDCDAYVGCHGLSAAPLGRLANAELRAAKREAHAAFDPLWKGRSMSRSQAYRWLAGQMGIPFCQCHIGMFNVEQCKQAVGVIHERCS